MDYQQNTCLERLFVDWQGHYVSLNPSMLFFLLIMAHVDFLICPNNVLDVEPRGKSGLEAQHCWILIRPL